MERLTERHCGVAVIKDKSKWPAAVKRLAEYENTGLPPQEIKKIIDNYKKDDWTPTEVGLPPAEEIKEYYVTVEGSKDVAIMQYLGDGMWNMRGFLFTDNILAWRPYNAPKPYESKRSENKQRWQQSILSKFKKFE